MTTLENEILGGQHDAELDTIAEAIRDRRAIVARQAVAGLRRGDTVRFSDSIRPKYLVGLTATVVKVNPKTIVVDCPSDVAYGRFCGALNVRCPNALIEGRA